MGTLHAWESFGDGVAVRLFNIHTSGLVYTYGRCHLLARYPGSSKRSWRRVRRLPGDHYVVLTRL